MTTEPDDMTIVCERCGSPRMVMLRLDRDWYTAEGSVYLINQDRGVAYEPDDEDFPDIEITMCRACGAVS